jgi:soluble lytic murein transglycosylase
MRGFNRKIFIRKFFGFGCGGGMPMARMCVAAAKAVWHHQDMRKSRLIIAFAVSLTLSVPGVVQAQQALAEALRLSSAKDWPAALSKAETEGPIARDIVEWQRLRAGDGLLGEYEDFFKRRPDWPGLPLMVEKGEVAVARSDDPARVISYFASQKPETGAGAVALIKALNASGRTDEGVAEARRAWVTLPFGVEDEAAMLALFPEMPAARHEQRLDMLLWQDRTYEAARMLPRVSADWQALAFARLGLAAEVKGVTGLVDAVPAAVRNDAGLAHARFIWRMKKDLYPDATELILTRSSSAESLGRPEAWAERRAVLARYLMRQGKAADAYRVASSHHLTEGGDYADLEFLSGFIALRKLDDPAKALPHFVRMQAAVTTPISESKALYWQARALDAAGRGQDALAAFTTAASHQTAYYGQLAAEHLGLPLDARLLDTTPPPDWREADFVNSSVLEAGLLLLRAGDKTLAKRFLLHLAETQEKNGLDQMADMALQVGQPHIALLIAKQAAERGIILPRAYFPVPDIVPDGLAVSRALALSIARRESEFDPLAQSGAGARGLMQVMPDTGKQMAGKLGVAFATSMLTEDPAFNTKMGSAYLAGLIEEFGPSVAMVASGYNAGPSRPKRWITEFGDPRRDDVDVVDWVETIPFSETRTYVMRVAESLVIYRAKLKGEAGPVRISDELKG